MTNENNSAQAQEIPVPPSGGSWTWSGAEWISNDPAPVEADAGDAAVQSIPYTTEQEQQP